MKDIDLTNAVLRCDVRLHLVAATVSTVMSAIGLITAEEAKLVAGPPPWLYQTYRFQRGQNREWQQQPVLTCL